MKCSNSLRRKTNFLICFVLLAPIFLSSGFAQQYKQLRITLDEGTTVTGKSGNLTSENVSCLVNGQLQTYSLDDVKLVSAKKGSAIKWAGSLGGCCLGTFALAGIMGDKDELAEMGIGPYIGATLMVTAVGAGIGYLIGALTDPWNNVYMTNNPMVFNRFMPIVNVDFKGRPSFGFSYRL